MIPKTGIIKKGDTVVLNINHEKYLFMFKWCNSMGMFFPIEVKDTIEFRGKTTFVLLHVPRLNCQIRFSTEGICKLPEGAKWSSE